MNAVIYARYSSHGQTEQSIEGQLRDNYAWAKQQGISVVGEYVDRARSGTKDTRPDFQRMIEDAAKKQFEMVIVWKLDRFARNRYDSAIYKARLKKFGVRVVSVKEAITDSPEGIILEGLLESMAEYYSANLAQNVRRGLRESIAKGNFCGGNIPYGYRVENKKLVIDDKTAPMVRYMFEQYAAGTSKKEIIDELNRRGYRSRHGKALSYNSLTHVLPNTVYIGQYTYGGEVVPDLAEPMIDRELFDRVQQRLKLTARAPATAKAKVSYLLAGKIFCGHCGTPMVGENGRSHTGAKYYYYACHAKKKRRGCKKKNERKDFIEWYVVEQTVEYLRAPGNIEDVAAAVAAEYRKEFSQEQIKELEKAIAQIDRDIEKLVDALVDAPKVARQRIADRMEALDAQKVELEADAARLRVASEIQLTEHEIRAWLHTFTQGDPTDENFRRRVIDVFINTVYLYDDRVLIFYNIRGGKQVSYIDLLNSLYVPAQSEGSDLKALGVPIASVSEPQYVFVKGIFGCIFYRMKDAEQ